MNIIAAVDKNWAIGSKGQRLVLIPADLKLLREETRGKVLVMGRKTLESFPGGQPLSGRTNVILSEDPGYRAKGARICHSLPKALDILKDYQDEDIFIIGGESIYRQFLPYCNVVHITFVDYEYVADAFFQNLEQTGEWKLVMESEEETYFDLCYTFRMYVRGKAVKSPEI